MPRRAAVARSSTCSIGPLTTGCGRPLGCAIVTLKFPALSRP